jgi:uncharacterized protein
MERIFATILITLLFAIALAPAAFAAEPLLVDDEAGILTDSQWERLTFRAIEIRERHQCDVAIVIIDEMTDDDGAYEWARFIFEEFDYGYSEDKIGLLLFLSMAERDYAMIAYGFGNTAFTDHGKDVMLDRHILPLLADNKYYEAFNAYLDKADEYLAMARAGTPFDTDTDTAMSREDFLYRLAAVVILPLLLAIVLCEMWKKQMKTAVAATTAHNYIPANGFKLTGQADMFLYKTQTRTKIEKNNSSRSGGGTTKDSKGYSGRSGKF